MNTITILQFCTVIGVGGFAGEFYRTADNPTFTRRFWANFLAGSFLSFMGGWWVFYQYQRKEVALIITGLLAYQDVEKLQKIINRIIKTIIKGGKDDNE